MPKSVHEECGIFGVYGHPRAAYLTYLGLSALQHRGQESAGITCCTDGDHQSLRGLGLVQNIFTNENIAQLHGDKAIGHVRYSTIGSPSLKNAQPLSIECWRGALSVAHNGNLINSGQLRQQLEQKGAIFQSSSDTEVIVHLLAQIIEPDYALALQVLSEIIQGAYSLLFLTSNALIAMRDPLGFRPLALGAYEDALLFSSESCAFDLIGAELIRELEPGEIVLIDSHGCLQCFSPCHPAQSAFCIFEYIYFSRSDSNLNGLRVYEARKNFGHLLATTYPVDADLVVPVPDSGLYAGLGFAETSLLPFELALPRTHYSHRTFIEPFPSLRDDQLRMKFGIVREKIKNKRITLVDDSIVRGTTAAYLVEYLRAAGAAEVHLRIASPPLRFPCYYGVDIPNTEELIASNNSIPAVRELLHADSLEYLNLEQLLSATKTDASHCCTACFTGKFPIPVSNIELIDKAMFETR